ncbi:MAG: ubiquinol-cytochrome c reductase iron-sulfur subunit [Candidatus Kryptoniota bacterium]
MDNSSDRRKFLKRLLGFTSTILAAYIIYPIIRFLNPPSVLLQEKSTVEVATTSELRPDSAKFFEFLDKPAVLVHLPDGGYEALSAKCTHLGCTVEFEPKRDIFYCNCHGSEFGIDGSVLKGPAVSPLPKYFVSINGNKVFVSVTRSNT